MCLLCLGNIDVVKNTDTADKLWIFQKSEDGYKNVTGMKIVVVNDVVEAGVVLSQNVSKSFQTV